MDLKTWWQRMGGGKHGPWLLALTAILALASLFISEGATGNASREEMRMGQVLSQIQGAGRVEVALYYEGSQSASAWEGESSPTPVGAVIVAQGGGEIGVKMQLIRAAATLLGLSQDKICVFPMGEGG